MRLLRSPAYAAYALAIVALLLFPGSEHDWMRSLDPTIDISAIESSGNRTVFAGLMLGLAVAAQGILIITSRSWRERLLSLTLVALAIWLFAADRLPVAG